MPRRCCVGIATESSTGEVGLCIARLCVDSGLGGLTKIASLNLKQRSQTPFMNAVSARTDISANNDAVNAMFGAGKLVPEGAVQHAKNPLLSMIYSRLNNCVTDYVY